jgi:pilus assembly protein CpaE
MMQILTPIKISEGTRINNMAAEIRLMIVDDNPQVRHGMRTLLELASKRCFPRISILGEAQNGEEAIKKLPVIQPDVILMDLEMPGMDGYDATEQIKSQHPEITIIALTIHNDPLSHSKAAQAGADAFIEKGAPLDELLCAIQM